jgi:hypothetical protein
MFSWVVWQPVPSSILEQADLRWDIDWTFGDYSSLYAKERGLS